MTTTELKIAAAILMLMPIAAPAQGKQDPKAASAPILATLERAKGEFKRTVTGAVSALSGAFDRAYLEIMNAKGLDADAKLERKKLLDAEKESFRSDGTLPTSASMAKAADDYRLSVASARGKQAEAYAKACDQLGKTDLAALETVIAERDGLAALQREYEIAALSGGATDSRPSAASRASSPKRNGAAKAYGAGAAWKLENDEIVLSKPTKERAWLAIADIAADEFDLTLEARADDGASNGFIVAAHWAATNTGTYLHLGALSNRVHRLMFHQNGKIVHLEGGKVVDIRNKYNTHQHKSGGSVTCGQYHAVTIKVRRENRLTCLVDGVELFSVDDNPLKGGKIAVGGEGGVLRFRNIKVTSADGKRVLWEGLPKTIDS